MWSVVGVTDLSHVQLHTSELNDGYDWGRLNLQSVTEQSSMDDFLATAELAGTEFVAGNRTSLITELSAVVQYVVVKYESCSFVFVNLNASYFTLLNQKFAQ